MGWTSSLLLLPGLIELLFGLLLSALPPESMRILEVFFFFLLPVLLPELSLTISLMISVSLSSSSSAVALNLLSPIALVTSVYPLV